MIDITPNWHAAAKVYIACLEYGTPEGKRQAREGIFEMAAHLDRINEQPITVTEHPLSDFEHVTL